jgi:hypothetical protein
MWTYQPSKVVLANFDHLFNGNDLYTFVMHVCSNFVITLSKFCESVYYVYAQIMTLYLIDVTTYRHYVELISYDP